MCLYPFTKTENTTVNKYKKRTKERRKNLTYIGIF